MIGKALLGKAVQPDAPLFRFRRDPRHQTLAIDKDTGDQAYSRCCTVTKEFILIRVPFDKAIGAPAFDTLNDDDRRFVIENVTPKEHEAHEH